MQTYAPRSMPASPVETIQLRDGTFVDLHPMRADDAAALRRFHSTLSSETSHRRFFAPHPELSDAEVERFTHLDHRSRQAIVAIVATEIVGVARFDALGDGSEAEVAFVVANAWQGRGLGTALFVGLAQRARAVGISRFTAQTLPHNTRMLAVFHHAGLPVSASMRDGVAEVVIELTGSGSPLEGTEGSKDGGPSTAATGHPRPAH